MWKFVLLLTVSNIFMNLAWYGHLKFKESALWLVILASWGLALFEYVFQVPANRIGSETMSVTQLKFCRNVSRSSFSRFSLISRLAKL